SSIDCCMGKISRAKICAAKTFRRSTLGTGAQYLSRAACGSNSAWRACLTASAGVAATMAQPSAIEPLCWLPIGSPRRAANTVSPDGWRPTLSATCRDDAGSLHGAMTRSAKPARHRGCALEPRQLQRWYRTLDQLLERKARIEHELYLTLRD